MFEILWATLKANNLTLCVGTRCGCRCYFLPPKRKNFNEWNQSDVTSSKPPGFQRRILSRVTWAYGKQMLLCETVCETPSHDGLLRIYQAGMQAADMFSLEKCLTSVSEHYPTLLGQMLMLPALLLPQRAILKCTLSLSLLFAIDTGLLFKRERPQSLY